MQNANDPDTQTRSGLAYGATNHVRQRPRSKSCVHPAYGFADSGVVRLPPALFTGPGIHELGPEPARRRCRFIGLKNFATLVSDPRFWNTARVTLFFVVGAVGLQYVLGLGLALLLNQEIRCRRFFRVVFLIPMMLTPAAVGYVGRMLFNESMGPINDIIQHLGGPTIPWISNVKLALPTLILLDTWEWVPFMTIVLLAGLQSLPPEVFESAGGWMAPASGASFAISPYRCSLQSPSPSS